MARSKSFSPKKWILIGSIALAVILAALFIFHAVSKQAKTSDADFFLVIGETELPLPSTVGDVSRQLAEIGVDIENEPASDRDYLHEFAPADLGDDGMIVLLGYNESVVTLDLSYYKIRALRTASPNAVIRGGKKWKERGKEFVSEGIHVGQTREEIVRILGEPDGERFELETYQFLLGESKEDDFYYISMVYEEDTLIGIRMEFMAKPLYDPLKHRK